MSIHLAGQALLQMYISSSIASKQTVAPKQKDTYAYYTLCDGWSEEPRNLSLAI